MHRMAMKRIGEELVDRRKRMMITGVEGSWAASLSIDIRGVIPVPPPMNTCTSFR